MKYAASILILLAAQGAIAIDYIPDVAGSRFLSSSVPGRVILEFRDETAVYGASVKLKDVVRCSAADASALDLTLEIPIAKIPDSGKLSLDISTVKKSLEDHGISLLGIHFSGAGVCQVSRLQDGLSDSSKPSSKTEPATQPAAVSSNILPLSGLNPAENPQTPAKTLKDILIQNICDRLGLDPQDIVLTFKTEDKKYGDLCESDCQFTIAPNKITNLGSTAWDVTIKNKEGEKRVFINSTVQAWRTQLRVTRPLAFHQTLAKDDVKETRILADRLGDNLTLDQVAGSDAVRSLAPGDILTSSNIQPGVLVKTGQLITVTVRRGSIELKWVAEARQNGAWGDIIRVRRPGTRDEFSVRLTGKEQGDLIDGKEVAAR